MAAVSHSVEDAGRFRSALSEEETVSTKNLDGAMLVAKGCLRRRELARKQKWDSTGSTLRGGGDNNKKGTKMVTRAYGSLSGGP